MHVCTGETFAGFFGGNDADTDFSFRVLGLWKLDRRQRAEGRRQKTEGRGQKADSRRQKRR
jgi:hypothetical protein